MAFPEVEDDPLRLMFTCCHPALAPEVQVALTLREVCGLTTEEIARAFLTAPATLAQRIVRAKNKIRTARIPYEVPERTQLPERLGSVLRVIYLVFSEGYAASSGDALTRQELSSEAIRTVRLLADLLPESEVIGLLALMLLHESRRAARASAEGDVILLDDQDRSLWDADKIAEGAALVARILRDGPPGPYGIQAAIAAEHVRPAAPAQTDWARIVALYEALAALEPSPVVELNRAVALAMWRGPAEGLAAVDAILARGALSGYHLVHATRADLCRRPGRIDEAALAYREALALARQEPERRFLRRRLMELGAGPL